MADSEIEKHQPSKIRTQSHNLAAQFHQGIKMPLPLIIAGAALLAGGYGVKKGIDGRKSHSEADEIIENTRNVYNSQKIKFDAQEKKTQLSLEQLGEIKLDIGTSIDEFQTIADELLRKINSHRKKKITVDFPQQKLEQIEGYKFAVMSVLGSVAGSGVAGVAAGFAVYGGVMTFAAASTGTAISALSGAAATNATLAALGGGAISAGGLGMAGGTAILGAAVAAPVLAIAGWAYANHGKEALENAKKTRQEANIVIEKLIKQTDKISTTDIYILKIIKSITTIYKEFQRYTPKLKEINEVINSVLEVAKSEEEKECLGNLVTEEISNGLALAAILVDIATTPIFKIKNKDEMPPTTEDNNTLILERDDDGFFILDSNKIDEKLQSNNYDATNQVI